MDRQQTAIEMCMSHPLIKRILGPIYDPAHNGSLRWDKLNYGVLSGGEKAAVSWVYAIWSDKSPTSPKEQKGWRDPFDGFCTLDKGLQDIIMHAFAYRHGWVNQFEEEEKT